MQGELNFFFTVCALFFFSLEGPLSIVNIKNAHYLNFLLIKKIILYGFFAMEKIFLLLHIYFLQ